MQQPHLLTRTQPPPARLARGISDRHGATLSDQVEVSQPFGAVGSGRAAGFLGGVQITGISVPGEVGNFNFLMRVCLLAVRRGADGPVVGRKGLANQGLIEGLRQLQT